MKSYKFFFSLSAFILVCHLLFAQAPVVSSFTPAKGLAGTTVTITGTNFDATPVNNVVYFGAVKATITEFAPLCNQRTHHDSKLNYSSLCHFVHQLHSTIRQQQRFWWTYHTRFYGF